MRYVGTWRVSTVRTKYITYYLRITTTACTAYICVYVRYDGTMTCYYVQNTVRTTYNCLHVWCYSIMTWRQCMASKKSKNGGITIKTQNEKTSVTITKNRITSTIFFMIFYNGNTKVCDEIRALSVWFLVSTTWSQFHYFQL